MTCTGASREGWYVGCVMSIYSIFATIYVCTEIAHAVGTPVSERSTSARRGMNEDDEMIDGGGKSITRINGKMRDAESRGIYGCRSLR